VTNLEDHEALVDRSNNQNAYDLVLDNLPLTVLRYDLEFNLLFINAYCQNNYNHQFNLGKTPEEDWSPNIHNMTAQEYMRLMQLVVESGNVQTFELRGQIADRLVVQQCKLIPEFNLNLQIRGLVALSQDITESVGYRQKIQFLAFHDVLTGLPNRAMFYTQMSTSIENAKQNHSKFAVYFLDLDGFKAINDTKGHPLGDKLLIEVANRIKNLISSNCSIARLGGDEFAVIYNNFGEDENIHRKASLLLDQFKKPFQLDGLAYYISASIGIAFYPENAMDAEDLVKYADSAMYAAKKMGRNHYHIYSPQLTKTMEKELALETALQQALQKNELYLEYQPIYELTSGLIVGAEALCRWKSDSLGLIAPFIFIPIAERSELVLEIGKWIMLEAFQSAVKINCNRSNPIILSINLSPKQFIEPLFLEEVMQLLNESDCNPAWIKFEITEGLLIQEDDKVLDMLNKFSSYGITISIDDFGTGYSALAYLNKFPIHQVKIDRSFINEITTNQAHALLVKTIIAMSESLGKEIVAEGVESTEQADLLKEMNCTYVQGYFFSRPLSLQAFNFQLNN
jgi:diguanylate cyclase (GGDEF)-like protein